MASLLELLETRDNLRRVQGGRGSADAVRRVFRERGHSGLIQRRDERLLFLPSPTTGMDASHLRRLRRPGSLWGLSGLRLLGLCSLRGGHLSGLKVLAHLEIALVQLFLPRLGLG